MNRNIRTLIIGLCLFLASCTDRKYDTLLVENERLKQEIDVLNAEIEQFLFRPVVVANSNRVQLGETFMADIRLAVTNNQNPPKIVLYEWFDENTGVFKEPYDTLEYDVDLQSSLYSIVPEESGHFTVYGKVLWEWDRQMMEFGFMTQYEVY